MSIRQNSLIESFPAIEHNGKEFICISDSSDISEKKGYKLNFADDIDMQVAIFRIDGKLYAVSNICPHRHQDKIFDGIIDGKNIICPLHGWTYNLETGNNIHPNRGQKNLIKYEIFENNGKVYLEKPVLIIPKWREQISL